MPISYPFKTIFVHVPKCAGTSIEKFLGMCGSANLHSFNPIKTLGLTYDKTKFTASELILFENVTPQHLSFIQLKKILPPEVINSFFKFTVVRNPYDRIVSEYSYLHETPTAKTARFRAMSFNDFLDAVFALTDAEKIILFDGHLDLQLSYVVDEHMRIGVNEVYKVEDISLCEAKLKQLTGGNFTLPHSRAMTFISNEECLTDITREKIYNAYKEDFIFFGYPQ